MKYNFQVGDLFLSRFVHQPMRTGIIVKVNEMLTYPYYVEWSCDSKGHYKQYEIVELIKNKILIYFPVVK